MTVESGTYTLLGLPPVLYWAEQLALSAAAIARAAELVRSGDGAGIYDDREELVTYMLDGVVILCKLSAEISCQLFEAETKRIGRRASMNDQMQEAQDAA